MGRKKANRAQNGILFIFICQIVIYNVLWI